MNPILLSSLLNQPSPSHSSQTDIETKRILGEGKTETCAGTNGVNSTLSTHRVLLVDDCPLVGESVGRMLANEPDIDFHYCSDPSQAIPLALSIAPTTILQDLIMPDVDGLLLVKFFRGNPKTKDIPIIVLSSREDALIKAEAFAKGVNDYLVKLPDPLELKARICHHSRAYLNLMRRIEAERNLAEHSQKLTRTLEDLKKTQSQLVQNEKMLGLGKLFAGVAHELNNPLTFISGNLNYVKHYTQQLLEILALYRERCPQVEKELSDRIEEIEIDFITEDLPKSLASLETGSQRINTLVASLRNFVRSDEQGQKTTDLHQGLESTLMILKHRLTQHKIKIVQEYDNVPLMKCDPGQINQVFLHLLTNAIDALEAVTIPQPTIKIRTEFNGDLLVIHIHDNGKGIPIEIRDSIFDPFFTTKPVGQGTGLGLSIAYQIVVEQHGGQLYCSSGDEGDTQFTLELPYTNSQTLELLDRNLLKKYQRK